MAFEHTSMIATTEGSDSSISLLGLKSTQKPDLLRAILLDDNAPHPSCLQCLLSCECKPRARRENGIRSNPVISNLAGLLFQHGEGSHATDGTVFTLKWADYDRAKREATVQVYGHRCCQAPATGDWSLQETGTWRVINVLARCCDYSYRFRFAEDYGRADIDIRTNVGLCCLPAWCTVPERIAHFEMVQDREGPRNGSRWLRNSSSCGGAKELSYVLEAVYGPDGKATEFAENFLNEAPKSMWLSR